MAAITILIVDKSGTIKETTIKTYDESELYKKAGFKTSEGFKLYAEWNIDDVNEKNYSISVFGKTTGKANQENKYDFPPPIDSKLFFGNCVIVNKNDNEAISITEDEWESIYDYLFGGFEDLGDEDTDEDSENDEDDGLPRTKDGYVKDDFVVDDDDDEFDDDEEEEEEEEEVDDDDEEVYIKKTKVTKKSKANEKKVKNVDKKTKKVTENVFTTFAEPENYLDCTSELIEEEYV
jgi:hypothetical protein